MINSARQFFSTKLHTIHFFILVLLLLLAFGLRAHNYWIVPLTDETADEMAWTWLGASLLQEGQPTSWSFYSQYENGHIYKTGVVNAPLVRPAVDHPPLFSLIPGTIHAITSDWEAIPSRKVIRLPMIFLGTANVFLLFLVARKFFSINWSYVAMTIYATVPIFVLSSRLVVAENLLITWTLLFILSLESWLQSTHQKKKYAVLLILISMLAILTKISGIVLPITLIAVALIAKIPRLLQVGLSALLLSILVLLLYMTTIDLPLFLSIQVAQADRLLGLTTLYSRFFIHPTVAKMVFTDGWLVLGFIASLMYISYSINTVKTLDKLLSILLRLLLIINLGFILTTVEEFSYHGWYSYTLFPLYSIVLVSLAKKIYAGNALLGAITWFLLLPTSNNIFTQLHIRDSLSNIHIRGLYMFGLVPILGDVLNNASIKKSATLLLAAMIVLANCISVFTITELSVRENNNYYFTVQPHNDVR